MVLKRGFHVKPNALLCVRHIYRDSDITSSLGGLKKDSEADSGDELDEQDFNM